jgi:hypothetical protein
VTIDWKLRAAARLRRARFFAWKEVVKLLSLLPDRYLQFFGVGDKWRLPASGVRFARTCASEYAASRRRRSRHPASVYGPSEAELEVVEFNSRLVESVAQLEAAMADLKTSLEGGTAALEDLAAAIDEEHVRAFADDPDLEAASGES